MMTFATTLGAVLAANLLTVMFVWGMMESNRQERDGVESRHGYYTPIGAAIAPLIVAAICLYSLI